MKTFGTRQTHDPSDYLAQFHQLSAANLSDLQPSAPPRFGVSAAGGADNVAAILAQQTEYQRSVLMANRKYEQATSALIGEMESDLRQAFAAGEILNKEVERLGGANEELAKKIIAAEQAAKDAAAAAEKTLGEIKAAADKDKTDAAAALKDLQDKFDLMQKELDELKAKATKLEDDNKQLGTDNADLEEANKKLGGNRIGLQTNPAAGASTEIGSTNPPTKTMSVAEIAAQLQTGGLQLGQGAPETGPAELISVLSNWVTLREASLRNDPSGSATRKFEAFCNQPFPGCEKCKTDAQHHKNLIALALKNRTQLDAIARVNNLSA